MILYHQTTIKPRYQAMLHVNATAQTCQIISIDQISRKSKGGIDTIEDPSAQILRTGDRGLVRFRFMQRAEYLKEGTKLIFREGRTKGLGTVKQTFPVKDAQVGVSLYFSVDRHQADERSSPKDGNSRIMSTPVKVVRSHDRQNTDGGKAKT
jgi:hypothetical protein